MKEGDVILTPVPQADGNVKNRPAIILHTMPGYGDFLVCGVSTQTHQYIQGFDEIISPADTDFVLSGLASESIMRKSIAGSIGRISPKRHKRLLKTHSDYLVQP